jgi:hypothetical protein
MIKNFFKSRHIWNIRNNIARFRKNFSNRGDKYSLSILDLLSDTFNRTFLGYFTRPFLYFNFLNNKKAEININELRENGFMKLSHLDDDLLEHFTKIFLKKSSQYYNSNFQNIEDADEYFQKNNIQRSNSIYLDVNDKKYLEFLKKNFISEIATNYLKKNKNNLYIVSFIFMLSKIDYKNEIEISGFPFPLNMNTEFEKKKFSTDSKNALHFHRDIDSYKFIKFFYYLSDCFVGNGHHKYITKSHRVMKIASAPSQRYLEEELVNIYKDCEIIDIVGKKGFGFAEDTFGFHRGTPVTSKYRVMMMTQVKSSNRVGDSSIPLGDITNYN